MKRWHASQRLPHRHLGLELPRRPTVRRVVMLMCPWGDHNIVCLHRLSALGLTPCLMCRRVHSPVQRHRCQALMWQAYSIAWLIVNTMTSSRQFSGSNRLGLKPKRKLPTANSKLNDERSGPTSARRTLERRPFNVNKRRKLRLISGKRKPELWQKPKYFSGRSKSAGTTASFTPTGFQCLASCSVTYVVACTVPCTLTGVRF